MNTVLLTNLRTARAVIDTPDKWIKGAQAEDAAGIRVLTSDPSACRFCMMGAVSAAVIDEFYGCDSSDVDSAGYSPLGATLCSLAAALPPGDRSVVVFNDTYATTHADVMQVFDKAIAAAEAA